MHTVGGSSVVVAGLGLRSISEAAGGRVSLQEAISLLIPQSQSVWEGSGQRETQRRERDERKCEVKEN